MHGINIKIEIEIILTVFRLLVCYYSVQNLLSSSLLSKNLKDQDI